MAHAAPRVVVIGASMAGILTARALAPYVGPIVLADRDEMPHEPAPRGGTPHSRHVHGLLSRGCSIIESLFPGATADLVGRGAVAGDAQADGQYVIAGSRLAPGHADLPVLAVSRPLLEWYLRRRLVAESGGQVTILEHTSALDLAVSDDERRVNGVVVADRDGGDPHLLAADLVVDASGRTSRTPEWLERHGYAPPPEEVRRVDKQYVTRTFRREARPAEPVVRAVGSTADNPRGGIFLANEGDRWTVGLSGMHGERPPTDLDGFHAWARSLVSPEIAEALVALQPLDEGARYRFPANRRRRYERVDRFPAGLVVVGDALCAFDPVYGQGMTVAAVEAEELAACLADGGLVGLAARFHERAAGHIDTPWLIAAGGTEETGVRRPFGERLASAYLARLLRAAASDPVLTRAFLRVNHLVDRPHDLMQPRLVARVLRADLARRTARAEQQARPATPVTDRAA